MSVIRSGVKSFLKSVFGWFGYEIISSERLFRLDPSNARMEFFRQYGINALFDVGANVGRFGSELRQGGYKGKIVSFEPLGKAFAALKERSAGDPLWKVHNTAIGDFNGESTLNVAANIDSSSLLDMMPIHLAMAPESQYIGTEKVPVNRLDKVFDQHYSAGDKVFLKVDTQGFEREVFAGAEGCLDKIIGVQVELSVEPLYKDSILLGDMFNYLYSKGFILVSIEAAFADQTSKRVMQFDGIFFRINK